MKKIICTIITLIFLLPATGTAARKPLDHYKNIWCKKLQGRTDIVQHEDVVIDCSTNDYVFIFEYSYRWRNAIGKALYYSLESGKRPGIVLVIERTREQFYFKLLKNLIHYFSLPIDTFQVGDGVSRE